MPLSGRGRDMLAGQLLAARAMLPGAPAGPRLLVENLLFGATLTATADPAMARVRVELYWPQVTAADVVRVDPDGTESPVRGGDPALVCTGWGRWDYEAPLDVAVFYRVRSVQAAGAVWESAPATVDSAGRAWLKHPLRPQLNRIVHIRTMGPRDLPARRGVFRPLDRTDPIVVYQPRLTDAGTLTVQTDGTWADQLALRALLADGAELLLQQPGRSGGESLYISVDTAGLELLDPLDGSQLMRRVELPFDVSTRQPGEAAGGAGDNYADLAGTYHSYGAVPAGEPSYHELALTPGP